MIKLLRKMRERETKSIDRSSKKIHDKTLESTNEQACPASYSKTSGKKTFIGDTMYTRLTPSTWFVRLNVTIDHMGISFLVVSPAHNSSLASFADAVIRK
jgi:hypothetical protein